jgi:exosortase/archaeosortase
MSAGDVAVLNTKLDLLIDDFKSFKRYSIGFLMALAIPFATYVVISLTENSKDIAVMEEKIHYTPKAIKEEQ